ncbi:alpha/beta hydrolase [Ornithinicoccus hortensis]|uniref:Putative membrane protein n=1 Tax=Ornithinicoccus hortensis TaxID=82346 RepID=A0A542YPF0_9MICO|nr:alpha/beta-hydrolase family protein [Ornithinicoccus hortensis]TQL49985.1 putative membrane protein [Ornithinicoccus hortensis]
MPQPTRTGLRRGFDDVGLTVALLMGWVALSPSLLPRTWWMTAANVGISTAFGYAVGLFIGWVAHHLARLIGLRVTVDPRAATWLWRAWYTGLALATLLAWSLGLNEQGRIARLLRVDYGGWLPQLVGILAGCLLFLVVVLLFRGLQRFWAWLRALFSPRVPRLLVTGLTAVVFAVVVVFVSNQVLYRQAMEIALSTSLARNAELMPGASVPSEPERSGGPGSAEPWDTLGSQGQLFASAGPRAADIERVTGEPALEPIRVYAGKQDDRNIEETAEAVVRELHRTGAFDREVLLIFTSTGTGWVSEWSVQALEYLTGGDLATASMQYSYFPSGLAYITDRTTPATAGRDLFEAVYAEWSALPEDSRPLLFVSGESLGSFGGQAAFDRASTMLDQVDGAVWSGTPRFSPLWSELTQGRREGSPEIAPVVNNGRHIRFVTRPEELVHDYYGGRYEDWEEPRVVYVQHASDPVVWWSPDLLWTEPDWMREAVGRDVTPTMWWAPWATFWQVASDMPISAVPPGGHGHNYHTEMVPVWAGVLGLDPTADYTAIEDALTAGIEP